MRAVAQLLSSYQSTRGSELGNSALFFREKDNVAQLNGLVMTRLVPPRMAAAAQLTVVTEKRDLAEI